MQGLEGLAGDAGSKADAAFVRRPAALLGGSVGLRTEVGL